jgi:uncharacterized protein YdhG (YjbR/CyaY superfamily)
MKTEFKDIDNYIFSQPESIRPLLEKIRHVILKAAPAAEEIISYGMPAFKSNGILVYFAGCKNHIGFYPTPSAIVHFKDELAAYEGAKGSVKFPLNQPIPFLLIQKIVKFRVKENQLKMKQKSKKKVT